MFVFANAVGTISPGITDPDICFAGTVYVLVASPSELISERERKGRTENTSRSFFGLFCDKWGPISESKCFAGLHLNGESAASVCGMYLFSWSLALFIAWRDFLGDGLVVFDAFFFFGNLDYKVSFKKTIEKFCLKN